MSATHHTIVTAHAGAPPPILSGIHNLVFPLSLACMHIVSAHASAAGRIESEKRIFHLSLSF